MNSSTMNNPATTGTGPSRPVPSWKRRAFVGGDVAVGAAAAATLVGYTGTLEVKGRLSADRQVLEAISISFKN
ncbi:MAG: hypothetical protein LW862_21730 [Rubrivivax sp.]|jgi:hypothetical protein|nr:hypothetical protein [Rubrivivax sp.]